MEMPKTKWLREEGGVGGEGRGGGGRAGRRKGKGRNAQLVL